jgi:ubiquinol-cytochrome c reductase cytochrome c1 subunit
MMKQLVLTAAAALMLVSTAAISAGDVEHPKQLEWSFDGVMGKVDKPSAQRGYQVYKEVCSSCHAMKRIAYRSLTEIGFSEAEVKALAATYTYTEIGDDGEPKERPGRPSDYFKSPFANKQAAQAANGGAYPPDLSLMVKARHDGANYLYSLITGYTEAPKYSCVEKNTKGTCVKFKLGTEGADVVQCATVQRSMEKDDETGKEREIETCTKMQPGLNYNPYFPGRQIAMAAPLSEGQVTFQDGTVSSVEQMTKDLVNFLQWAAEPEMEHRKAMGLNVLAFLGFMTVFFFFAYKRVWKNIH